ncbi:MAG: ABC transporter permease [Chloroflexota bacterium]|nr:MAG: ABC transporter permease [Chloroflexota bacterium]
MGMGHLLSAICHLPSAMLEILRNMSRRKVRTGLTIFGIVVGIFAVTVMGSMTEYFNSLIDNARQGAGEAIIVTPKGGIRATLSTADIGRIERVQGVKAAVPQVATFYGSLGSVSFGPPDQVLGIPPEQILDLWSNDDLAQGRWLQRGDTYQMVVGSNIAKKEKLKLGSVLEWREKNWEIVGLLKETQTAPDGWLIAPMDIVQKTIKRPDLISQINVIPEDTAQATALVAKIKDQVSNVNVQTLDQQLDAIEQGLAVFNAILLSSAVLAAIIGGLAVVNTMIMSVSERTPEIGLKKAIGATNRNIISEFLLEAAVIGLLGGAIGFLLGWGVAALLNLAASEALGGAEIFKITPRLAAIAIGFAVTLGIVAGLLPAWNASRLDPVVALREEA